jgi:hypothetical protein
MKKLIVASKMKLELRTRSSFVLRDTRIPRYMAIIWIFSVGSPESGRTIAPVIDKSITFVRTFALTRDEI